MDAGNSWCSSWIDLLSPCHYTRFALTYCISAPSLSAGIGSCAVEVEVQDHDAGGGTQGPGLESQGADLNDADQTKCMPCVLM